MKKTVSGFTVVELLVVIVIIGILSTVGFVSFYSIQANVRDSERSSRVKIISEALEKYYDKNGEYPSCAAMSSDPSVITSSVLPGIDPAVFTTPTATSGTNSILPSCGDLTSGADGFAYIGDGSNACLTGNACLQYSLKYREEETGSVISAVSRRVVSVAGTVTASSAPVMTISISGDNHVVATITPVTCPTAGSIAYYGIDSRTNDGIWSGYTSWSSTILTLPSPPTAAYGVKYGYRAQARCWVNNYSYSTNISGSEVSITRPIDNAPSVPSVAYTTSNWHETSFHWDIITCPTGTTARYQYDYTVKNGATLIDDSGWIQTANTSLSPYTTSKSGLTYLMDVKAQCYNTYGSGPWSSAGHAEYTRPNPTIKVLVVAGGGGGGGGKGGGGGGGGVVYNESKSVDNQAGHVYSLSVGGGGSSAGLGSNGGTGFNSVFDNIIALGGGGGGAAGIAGNSGGSGGGGGGISSDSLGGAGNQPGSISGGYGQHGGKGQNRSGGDSGGGGGGAGMIGGDAFGAGGNGKMAGGDGITNIITGSMYGGGGGGGACCYSGGGGGGGGGHGGEDGNNSPTAGTANTGGGGGGSGPNQSASGAGGSGIILISYNNTQMSATFTGGTSITNGSTVTVTFSNVGSGTFTVSG